MGGGEGLREWNFMLYVHRCVGMNFQNEQEWVPKRNRLANADISYCIFDLLQQSIEFRALLCTYSRPAVAEGQLTYNLPLASLKARGFGIPCRGPCINILVANLLYISILQFAQGSHGY